MNFKAIAIATILGLSAPTIADIAISSPVFAATKFDYPSGNFVDKEWKVNLSFHNNAYYYKGQNLKKGSNITLVGATTSGDKQRQVYTWRNDKYKYQVAWRTNDPHVIRVQVISANGKIILDRLLSEVYSH
jgi:hypothetical protein